MFKKRYFAHITRVSKSSLYDTFGVYKNTNTSALPDFRARELQDEEEDSVEWGQCNDGTIQPNQAFFLQLPVIHENVWIEMPDKSTSSRSLCGFKPCRWFIDFDLYEVGLLGMRKIAEHKGFDEAIHEEGRE